MKNNKYFLFKKTIQFSLLLAILGSFLISINSGEIYLNNQDCESNSDLESADTNELEYGTVNKFVDGEYCNFDPSLISDEGDGNVDNIPTLYSFEYLRRNNAVSAYCTSGTSFSGGANTVQAAIDAGDDLRVVAPNITPRDFPSGSFQKLVINYQNNHLTLDQKKNLEKVYIDYRVKAQGIWGLIQVSLGASRDLSLYFATGSGTLVSHSLDWIPENNHMYAGTLVYDYNSDFVKAIQEGSYVNYAHLGLDVDSSNAGQIHLEIDQLIFRYQVKTNYERTVEYDINFNNIEDIDFLGELQLRLNFNSQITTSVYLDIPGSTIDITSGYIYAGTFDLSSAIADLKDLFYIDEYDNHILKMVFHVNDDYSSNIVFPGFSPSIAVDCIKFSYSEMKPPDLILEDIEQGEILYCHSPPQFSATATDWSGIDRVVINNSAIEYEFDLAEDTTESYELGIFSSNFSMWCNYFQDLDPDSNEQLPFSITAYDVFGNSNSTLFNMVRDVAAPVITFDMETLTDDAPEIKFEIIEKNLNLSKSYLIFNNLSEEFTYDIIHISNNEYSISPEDFDDFSQKWDQSNDGNLGISVHTEDYTGLVADRSITISKDTTEPEMNLDEPQEGESCNDTPDIRIQIIDDNIDENLIILNASVGSEYVICGMEYWYGTLGKYEINSVRGDYEVWDQFFMDAPIGRINLSYYAEDLLGHNITVETYIMKIDSTLPEITLLSGDNQWHSVPVYVSASASDYNLDTVFFTIDDELAEYPIDTNIPQDVWNLLSDGTHIIHVWANDTAANMNTVQYNLKKDTEAPIIYSVLPELGSAFNEAPYFAVNVSDVENAEELTIYYEFSDVQGSRFWIQNNTITQLDSDIWENQIPQGQVEILINVTDDLGFSNQIFYSFIKDTFYPIVNLNTLNYTAFFEEVPVIQYSANEYVTYEIYYHEFRFDMNYWIDLAYEMQTFELKFIDVAGNTVNFTLYLDKRDSIDPVLTLNYPQNGEEVSSFGPTFSITALDDTLFRLTYQINGQSITVPFEDGVNSQYDITFTIDQEIWDDAYNQTVDITIYAIDEFENSCNITVTLVRSDFISEYTNEGLGLGLFMDMPIQMIIALGIAVVLTVGIQFIAYKKHRNVKIKIPEVQS